MTNTPEQTNDYPFFTAAPAKAKNTGWKIATAGLSLCLAVTLFLLASGPKQSAGPDDSTGPSETIGADQADLQTRLAQLEEENAGLLEENADLKSKNTQLSNRVVELLNQCNSLSMKLEQGSLSDEEIQEITDTVDTYEMLIECYIAVLRQDKATLSANVPILMEKSGQLSADARSALYIILEYMDKL